MKPGCGSNLASRFEALADTLTPNPTLASNVSGWFLFLLVGDPLRILSTPLPLHPSLHQWPPPPSLRHIKKRAKGWDSKSAAPRSPESGSGALPTTRDNFALSSSGPTTQVPLDKMYETMPVQDGSAAVHTVVHCTLADLACTMNLRVKDTTFALNECGLLVRREGEGDMMTIAIGISQEMVKAIARERNIKRMCIDFTKVLL